jgi:hypothetical protein
MGNSHSVNFGDSTGDISAMTPIEISLKANQT